MANPPKRSPGETAEEYQQRWDDYYVIKNELARKKRLRDAVARNAAEAARIQRAASLIRRVPAPDSTSLGVYDDPVRYFVQGKVRLELLLLAGTLLLVRYDTDAATAVAVSTLAGKNWVTTVYRELQVVLPNQSLDSIKCESRVSDLIEGIRRMRNYFASQI